MPNRLRSRLGSKKLIVSALIAIGAVGGSVAYAYPPGTKLDVVANVTSTQKDGADVTVTVDNADPRCRLTVSLQGSPDVVLGPGMHGTTVSSLIHTSYRNGQHPVTATTSDCPAPESADTTYTITNQRIETDADSYPQDTRMKVQAYNFTPGAEMTFRFFDNNGDPDYSYDQTFPMTDSNGDGNSSFFLDVGDYPVGSWTLLVYTGSVTQMKTITITPGSGNV